MCIVKKDKCTISKAEKHKNILFKLKKPYAQLCTGSVCVCTAEIITTKRVLKPSSLWIKTPFKCALEAEDYNYLKLACRLGSISYGTMLEWCQLCFSGMAPDWVWYGASRKEQSSVVWRKLRGIVGSAPSVIAQDKSALCGQIWWNSGIKKIVNKQVEQITYDYATKVLTSARKRQSFPPGFLSLVELALPSCTETLAVRVKVGPRLALKMWLKTDVSVQTMVNLLMHARGMGGQFFSNWACAIMCKPFYVGLFNNLVEVGAVSRGLEYYIAVTKELHDVVRLTRDLWCPALGLREHCTDYQDGMYTHLFAGRFYFDEIASSEEIAARTMPVRAQKVYMRHNGWTEDNFYDVVAKEIQETVGPFVGGKLRTRNWHVEDVISHLQSVGTSGSASVMRKVKLTVDDQDYRLDAPTKTAWLASLTTKKIRQVLMDKAEIRTKSVDKYESGKLRLLLPGPLNQWLIESLVLMGGEKAVYKADSEIAIQLEGMEELISYTDRLNRCASDYTKVNSDFKDHNILHQYKTMQMLWLAYAEQMDPGGKYERFSWGSEDFTTFCGKACRWLAASLHSAWAKGNFSDDKFVQLVRGLWSGWRSTTFINTLFNKFYAKCVETSFEQAYGCKPILKQSLVGDDMEGVAQSEWHALRYLELLDVSGFDAVASKQLVTCDRSEFLRLMYSEGEIRGSLARAISGFTSADSQSSPLQSGPDTANAFYEAMATLRRRGAVGVSAWENTVLQYWGRIVYYVGKKKKVVDMPRTLARTSSSYGGLGLCDTTCRPVEGSVVPQKSAVEYSLMKYIRQLPNIVSTHAVRAAEQAIAKKGLILENGNFLKDKLSESMLASSLPNVLKNRLKYAQNRANAEYYIAWREGVRDIEEVATDFKTVEELSSAVDAHAYQAKNNILSAGVSNPIKSLEAAVSIALDTLASQPEALSSVVGSSSLINTVVQLGGIKAAEKMMPAVAIFGTTVVERMLRQAVSFKTPTVRGMASVSQALIWPCLLAVSSIAKGGIESLCLPGENLVNTVERLVRVTSSIIARHPYWRRMMRF